MFFNYSNRKKRDINNKLLLHLNPDEIVKGHHLFVFRGVQRLLMQSNNRSRGPDWNSGRQSDKV